MSHLPAHELADRFSYPAAITPPPMYFEPRIRRPMSKASKAPLLFCTNSRTDVHAYSIMRACE
jgi:hypothetical protein